MNDPPSLVAGATILSEVQPVAPVKRPTVEPVAPVMLTELPEEQTLTQTEKVHRVDDLAELRQLAHTLMRDGQFDLAADRFQAALKLAPEDADLLVDRGSALYRLRNFDQAHDHFASANKLDPNHHGALDGLALVAATQKRYPEAREHLKHLLDLQPNAGLVWLRFGDIEHRLGNRKRALQAWTRVLQTDADAELLSRAQRRLDYFSPHDPVSRPAPQGRDDRRQQKPAPTHRYPRRG